MSNVATAFNAVVDIVSCLTSLDLRLSLTSFLMNSLHTSMVALTHVLCAVSTTVDTSELERNVVWIAYTQKELMNQHSSLLFHHSEKLFSLFKSVMVDDNNCYLLFRGVGRNFY